MTGWVRLQDELNRWNAARLILPFWWRDDDAVSDTPDLQNLCKLTGTYNMPLCLAVIPARADASLADRVAQNPHVVPAVHGWRHENHAPAQEKKAEFGAHRPLDHTAGEAARGLHLLSTLFEDRAAPIFVPPWNRMDDDLFPHLAEIGYTMVSKFGPRASATVAEGLSCVNTHIDPIDWRGTRSLVAEDTLLDLVVSNLHARRAGTIDAREPLGLLTHHLVHDTAIWTFCERLVDTLLSGPARPWAIQPETDL